MNTNTLTTIREGSTQVFVHLQKTDYKGPGAKIGLPFYNPTMEFNRDTSILAAQWLIHKSKKPIQLLDGLAATGIRGIRFATELSGNYSVILNEWNQEAFSLIEKNIAYNNIETATPVNGNLHRLLSDQRFNYIDVDPFGSPAVFLDGALRSIAHEGIVACTATDTAALCGVYPQVCLRRYGAWPLHGFLMREIGLRILLGVMCREAAKHEKGIRPLWSFVTDHYFRLYVQVMHGKRFVNEAMKQYRLVDSHELPLAVIFSQQLVGPIWLGSIHHRSFLSECQRLVLTKELGTRGLILQLLERCLEEADMPAFFYSTDAAASLYKMSPPKVDTMLKKLLDQGYQVSRSSLSSYGFRTTAPREVVLKTLTGK
jgi:tRNA (guanine26-N2/guanine27-N2)-dimethyltransferase